MITKYGSCAVVQIARVFERVYHVACQRVLWNGTFWTNIYPRFWECVIWQINQLWNSSFFCKCSKFYVNFENARKSLEKAFCFWDNCFWIGCVKLSLLRREYWSSAVNVLTNTYKLCFWLKPTFSDSITLTMITKYGNGAVIRIATVFERVYHVASQRSLWNGTFWTYI